MKKHKYSKPDETSAPNRTAELFVLPPDLLAKLGINLSNVQSSEVQQPVTNMEKGSEQNIDDPTHSLTESRDASSIIETANLMKESVFLSPTFHQTVSNLVPDDDDEEEVPIVINKSVSKDIIMCEDITPELGDNIIINSNPGMSDKQSENLENYESIKEYQVENQDGNLILTDVSDQNAENANFLYEKSQETSPIDEHADEAYLSDCSNSFSGFSPESINSEINKQKLLNKIIEESEAEVNEFYCIREFCTPFNMNSSGTSQDGYSVSNISLTDKHSINNNSTLQFITEQPSVPKLSSDIPSENIISWIPIDQRKKEIPKTKSGHNTSIKHQSHHINDSLNDIKQSDDSNMVFIDSNRAINLESYKSGSKFKVCAINESEKPLKETNELTVQKNIKNSVKNYSKSQSGQDIKKFRNSKNSQKNNLSTASTESNRIEDTNIISDTSNPQDKVKGITNKKTQNDSQNRDTRYISQIAHKRQTVIRNCDSNKETNLSNLKIDPMKTNLCIQEGEKPEKKDVHINEIVWDKLLKTYRRNKIRKQVPPVVKISDKLMTSDSFQLPNNHNIEIQSIKVGALCSQTEFCECYDFGNLAYYDCEMLYEHIHFLNHKNINCASETLYSIYDDDYNGSEQTVDCIEAGHHGEHIHNKTLKDNICGNNNVTENNDEKIRSTISGSKISKDTSSTGGQKNSKIVQKTCLPTCEINDADKIRKCVNIIKCGVCNESMLEIEWEVHKETKHNSVAWKADKKLETKIDTNSERSTSNSNSEFGLSSPAIKQPNLKYNSSPKPAVIFTTKSTRNSVDASPRSIRISEMDFHSNSNKESDNVEIEVLPKPSTNETDLPSKLRKISTISEKDVIARSTRRLSKTDVIQKIHDIPADIIVITSPKHKYAKLEPISSSKSSKVQEVVESVMSPKPTRKSSSNLASDASNSFKTSSKAETSFSPKTERRSSKSKPTLSMEIIANAGISPPKVPKNLSHNETSRHTENKKIKDDSSNAPTKCVGFNSSINDLTKLTITKEVDGRRNTAIEDTALLHVALPSKITSPRRKSLNIEAETVSTSTKTTNIVIISKLRRSSKIKNDAMELSANSIINVELRKQTNAKEIDAPTVSSIENTESLNKVKDIAMNTSTRSTRSLGKETEPASKASKSSNTINTPKQSSKINNYSSDLLTKPTNKIELMKSNKTKEIVDQIVRSTGKPDSLKLAKVNDLNTPTRTTRTSSVKGTEDTSRATTCCDTDFTSENLTSGESTKRRSIKTDLSISIPNSKEIKTYQKSLKRKLTKPKITNGTHVTVTPEATINQTGEPYSNLKSDESLKTTTNVSAKSPKKASRKIEDSSNTSAPIGSDKSLKLHKRRGSTTSSRLSKLSTNINISESSSKSTKRSSNYVTVNTPLKKVKTTEVNDYSTPANISSDLSSLSDSKITEKNTEKSSIIEIDVPMQPTGTVYDTTPKNKLKKMVVTSVSASTEGTLRRTYSNKKKPNISTSVTCIEPYTLSPPTVTPCLNETIESTITEELSISNAIDGSETSPENYTVIEIEAPTQISDNLTKCGVCGKSVEDEQWIEHISKEHNYLAWRDKEPSLDLKDKKAVLHHLNIMSKQNDGLICSKCGLLRKFAKPFYRHINSCNGNEEMEQEEGKEDDDCPLSALKPKHSRSKPALLPPVTCGVCAGTVERAAWIEHIRVAHKYLAWEQGETPLNLDDEAEVKSHLNYISKHHGGLLCSKCGSRWNYVKKYLLHEDLCGLNTPEIVIPIKKIEIVLPSVLTCGVCKLEMEGKDWVKHIQQAHEYMAWIEGETPLDANDPVQVKEHLNKIIQIAGELVCMKCGLPRKFERAYSLHVKACINSGFNMKIVEPSSKDKNKYECGVCNETGNINQWKQHAVAKHYNIAWMVGDLPINLRNPYAVEKYLKEYAKHHSLVCRNCKASRASCFGFYAHILTCGKSEEEIDAVHNFCDICNNKYLCVYRNQHIAMHRDQVFRRERREEKARIAAEEAAREAEEPVEELPMGKRKAAEKAMMVLGRLSSNVVGGKHVCSCGSTFENEEELSHHNCDHRQLSDDDDSDVSIKMEPESESGNTDIDSTISDQEEEELKKKKRQSMGEATTKIARMSYRVNNYTSYLVQSYKNFCDLHYTSDCLFNNWRNSECEVVPDEEMPNYLPTLTESCKVRFDDSEWMTFNRFESKKVKGYSMFTGGAIQCMSWAPPHVADETLGNYLAVATHRGPDTPQHGPDEAPEHPGLLQIWDFQQFNFLPKCSIGLAHDYGIVWAMDWCPSGGRDRVPHHCEDKLSSFRLGLLAVACSNGIAYILAVPYPPAITESEFVMRKLKPVAELRLSMISNERNSQATSIMWSQQKGHDIIIVGYSNGATALYDLNTESSFLRATENDVTIFYPFQDKLSENSSITGVGICPTANESYTMGGFCSASITGASVSGWPSTAPSVRCHLAASGAYYSPHWPAVMLSGDAPLTAKSVNELEWWGGGRRLGASRAVGACARCGRAVAAAAPAVRLLRAHPCYPEIKKLIVATLLMVPIGQNIRRKVNDEISMVVEPLTYVDSVDKYGLQLSLVNKNDQVAAQKLCTDNDYCPERFPLSEIVAAAFCPTARFHEKLTLATHAGMIFVITT